jgi:2-oxoglutarate ferredoxin oxidoreductase subunit delta
MITDTFFIIFAIVKYRRFRTILVQFKSQRSTNALKGTIVVNENLCKACELCVVACPQHVISLNKEIITRADIIPRIWRKKDAPAVARARWFVRKPPSLSTAKKG